MDFKKFTKKAYESKLFEGSPLGDFIADTRRDKTFRNFKTWDELETYLIFSKACDEAKKAGKDFFEIWEIAKTHFGVKK